MTAPAPILTGSLDVSGPLRTLIVDDSVVVRTVIARILDADPRFRVVHKSNSAEQALAYLETQDADLVLLDIELPGQSGLAALPAILRSGPRVKVAILSANCDAGSSLAVEALALGAGDILSKPGSGSFGERFPQHLIERLSRLCGVDAPPPAPASPAGQSMRAASLARPDRQASPLRCLGIGASTGGIRALGDLFTGLELGMGVPILLTQHLPASFIVYFAQQLARMTPLPVKVAQTGDVLVPDTVHIAPGDAHLVCGRGPCGRVIVTLDRQRTPGGYLPGVDPMFSAMARIYGAGAAGIVLTGMGRDGTAGARDIVAAGGWIVAQDEASSVVWGMPGSVVGAGLACAALEPGAIMNFVARRGRVSA
ncbi:MAG: chemotaxis protein CheB [Sphingobium sp.]